MALSTPMQPPQALSDLVSQLLDQLNDGPVTGVELAHRLEEPVPLVNSTLDLLKNEGYITQVGYGWRPLTLDELYASDRRANAVTYRLTITSGQAFTVFRALELVARLGMGQLNEIFEPMRWGTLRRPDGTEVPPQAVLDAEVALQRFKDVVVGMSSSGFRSIGSATVPALSSSAWEASVCVRHRLAWDATSQGCVGTWFDEPLARNIPEVWRVTSQGPRTEKELRTHLVFIDMDDAGKALLERALAIHTRIATGDYQVLLDLALTGGMYRAEHSPKLDKELVAVLQKQLQDMRSQLLGLTSETAGYEPPAPEGADAAERILAGLQPVNGTQPLPENHWPALPAGYVARHHAGVYRLVGPSSTDGLKVQKGYSHSLQTLLYMAQNLVRGQPERNFRGTGF